MAAACWKSSGSTRNCPSVSGQPSARAGADARPAERGHQNRATVHRIRFPQVQAERGLAAQRYPNIKKSSIWRDNETRYNRYSGKASEVEVVDFWYCDGDGAVWNAVVVDGIFAKQPKNRLSRHPHCPKAGGDSSPIGDEEFKSLSIRPIKTRGPINAGWPRRWGPDCSTTSGRPSSSRTKWVSRCPISTFAQATTPVPMGTKVEMVRGDVNVPLAQTMLQAVEGIQQSTFLGVMQWRSTGQMSAGYGVSILADQVRGRIAQFRNNLESTLG